MYSIIIIFISLLAILGESRLRFNSPPVLVLSFFILLFFIGFRDQVGTDWELTYANFLRSNVDASFDWLSSPPILYSQKLAIL